MRKRRLLFRVQVGLGSRDGALKRTQLMMKSETISIYGAASMSLVMNFVWSMVIVFCVWSSCSESFQAVIVYQASSS